MGNRRTALLALLACLAATQGLAADYKPIPVFTDEFIRTESLTRIPLHVDTGGKGYPTAWSVRGGVPLPKGGLVDAQNARVLNGRGEPVSFQVRPLAWWEAGKSVKWLEVQFTVPAGAADPTYYLEYGRGVKAQKRTPLAVRESDEELVVDTGALRARISKRRGSLLEGVRVARGGKAYDALRGPAFSYIELRDIGRRRSGFYSTLADKAPRVKIERAGAESVTVLLQAWHKRVDGERTFPVDVRLTFFRGQPRIRIFHTFYVSENPAVVLFPALGLKFPLGRAAKITAGVDGESVRVAEKTFSLWQDSSEIPLYPTCDQFKPFCKIFRGLDRHGKVLHAGAKADGWIRLADGEHAATVTLRRMWQEFPKGFSVRDGSLRVEFWPAVKPTPMDLRRIDQRFPEDYQYFKVGEGKRIRGYEYNMKVYHRVMLKERELRCSAYGIGKSHEVWLDFSPTRVSAPALAKAAGRPLLPFVTPAWNRFTNALGAFHPEDRANFPTIEAAWELHWDALIKHQREWFNWYGMFNWGDFQTDYFPAQRRWGYYNTKYSWRNGGMEIPYSIYLWYLRSGKRKYFDLAETASLHLMDICSGHPRAWSDERLFHKTWAGGGGSRYDKNHWGSGRGYDPQHCFSHSIQIHWLVTGETHARDVVTEYAENYYKRDKIFNYWLASGKMLHYHGRTSDMPARLAANAYENDPLDPRWIKMLDFFLAHQAEGLNSTYIDESGRVRRRCNGLELSTFYYTLYKSPTLNYLLTVKECPELVAACKKGLPLYRNEAAMGSGITFHILYLLTGNRNYAKFAARQAAHYLPTAKSHAEPTRDMRLIPHVMGGTWSTYPALLESAVMAHLPLNPDNYDSRELNYYPVAEPGPENAEEGDERRYEPIDIRPVCNRCAYTADGAVPAQRAATANSDPSAGPVRFDFGPVETLAPGSLPVTQASHYPTSPRTRQGAFTALPFGACTQFKSIPFWLLALSANKGSGLLVVEDGKTYTLRVNAAARKIHLLTGASLAKDPFHEGAGAQVRVVYADGTSGSLALVNMVHYQSRELKRLYFSRKFYAGKLNDYHISVVELDTGGKRVESLTIADTGRRARLCVFAATVERAAAAARGKIFEEKIGAASKESLTFRRKLPNGLYTVAARVSMEGALGSPLDILLQGKLVVNHAVPTAPTTYRFQAQVTDGALELKLLPGEIHHKRRAGEGVVRLDWVRVEPPREPSWMPPARRHRAGGELLIYGWRLRGERAVMRDRPVTRYRKTKEPPRDPEKLLDHDCALMDGYGVGRAEFLVDVPDGKYKVELALAGPDQGEANVTVRFEGEATRLRLQPNRLIGGAHKYEPRITKFKKTVSVRDGRLNVAVWLPPKEKRKMWDVFGICSLTLERVRRDASAGAPPAR